MSWRPGVPGGASVHSARHRLISIPVRSFVNIRWPFYLDFILFYFTFCAKFQSSSVTGGYAATLSLSLPAKRKKVDDAKKKSDDAVELITPNYCFY